MSNESRNTIQTLILIGYSLILLAVLGLGWYSIKSMLQLQTITQNLYTHPFAVSNAATRLDETLFHLQNNVVKTLLIKGDNENLEQLRNEAEAQIESARADLEVIKTNFLGDISRVKELDLKFKQWDAVRLEIYAATEKGDHETAENLVRTVSTYNFAEVFPIIDYVRSFALERAKSYVEEAGKHYELTSLRTSLLIALLAVFIMIISLLVFLRVRHLQMEHEQNLRRLMEAELALKEGEARSLVMEAERASHAKSEFLSRMSHELRTPLHAIIAFSDLILYEKELEPKLKKHIQHINKAGDHLLALIDDVLDLASIESGELTIIVKSIKLQSVLEECYSLITPIALDAEVSLSFDTDVNYIVKANHTSLKQALLNLLSNAVKYNIQKGTVTVSYEVKDDKRLRINVIDTGYGISSKRQKRLFKPFERMGFELSKVEGTGIGLTITKQLLELMGGTVGVESTEGKGSNFWVELVLSDEQNVTQAESALKRNTINKTQQSKHIIYVEDDPINAHLMSEIFNKLTNHHLVVAKTGNEGLKLILEQLPDIVLLDINLPDMDGYEILENMRAHPQAKKIPVIAMTAKAMMDDVERGERAGFDDYIVKPARAAELLKSIELVKREYK